ncbi:hypothetical protein MMAN_16430 [Mycobacterium mantenii]|uniref:Uncharacterized protein n=1 Tax=Mycobacterium mantenii TaxID=560555 RepID=A0A1X0FDU0_MYCNT|nr:hypothetical protein [Mycobacterium mantenii]MCV7245882.1 hypothetical protein [Mycobacterium mantenii]ORA99824.1 hypothetical protein BST30_23650 [Mycobacterium mantenii]BBY37509.1 hypothetical protein MMAN_16430 [Mycobacterium mantenii]
MNDETTTTEETELSPEALDIAVKATAGAEFTDSFRPPTPGAAVADEQPVEPSDTEEPSEVDTLKWLLAERDYRLDNPDENTEAARHRHARREAEAQTQAVTARLEAMQRAAIDAQVTAMGLKPAVLWAAGANLADLLGEDGTPDTAKVEAAAEAAKETLGVVAYKPVPARLQSGAMATPPKRDAWVDAFAPKSD